MRVSGFPVSGFQLPYFRRYILLSILGVPLIQLQRFKDGWSLVACDAARKELLVSNTSDTAKTNLIFTLIPLSIQDYTILSIPGGTASYIYFLWKNLLLNTTIERARKVPLKLRK